MVKILALQRSLDDVLHRVIQQRQIFALAI
jgi:hypothetical protein